MIVRYVEVSGTTAVKYPYLFSDLQSDNPYTDYGTNYDVAYWFPMTDTAIENDYVLEEVTDLPQPEYDPYTKNCVQNTMPELVDGVWVLGWTVTNKTAQEKAEYVQSVKNANKSKAEGLLSSSDWTAIPSVADPQQSNPYLANQQAFLDYRSLVREIAVNPPSTTVTNWPVIPAEEWVSA